MNTLRRLAVFLVVVAVAIAGALAISVCVFGALSILGQIFDRAIR